MRYGLLFSFILTLGGLGVLIWYVDTGLVDINVLSREECPIKWFGWWLLASYGAFFFHSLAYFIRHLKDWIFLDTDDVTADQILEGSTANPGWWYVIRDWILVTMEFGIIIIGVVMVIDNHKCLQVSGTWSQYPFNLTLTYYQQTVIWISFHAVLFIVSLCIGCVHSAFFAVLYYNEKLEAQTNRRWAEEESSYNSNNQNGGSVGKNANSSYNNGRGMPRSGSVSSNPGGVSNSPYISDTLEDAHDPLNDLLAALIVDDEEAQRQSQGVPSSTNNYYR